MAVDTTSPLSRVIPFQYNPETLTRTLTPRSAPAQGEVGPADAHRLWGAPVETIKLKLELDATDQLEQGDSLTESAGILPQLAALEMLLHPSVFQLVSDDALLDAGTIEILPPQAPLTVLAYGDTRIVPIRIESLSVTEEAHDPKLHPIRAAVDLSAQVLTVNDLDRGDTGYGLYLAHRTAQEVWASISGANATFTAVAPIARAAT